MPLTTKRNLNQTETIMRFTLLLVAIASSLVLTAQNAPGVLTVEKIMRDPRWIGYSPSGLQWSADGRQLAFNWNPGDAESDSMYVIEANQLQPRKLNKEERMNWVGYNSLQYNNDRTAYVYARNGDIYYHHIKSRTTRRITHTVDNESSPQFSFNNTAVVYRSGQNLFAWTINTGEIRQLTQIAAGPARERPGKESEQDEWLKKDQLQYFEVLRERKDRREKAQAAREANRPPSLRSIPLNGQTIQQLTISPDGRFISYSLYKAPTGIKSTIVPDYVTESGYTTDIPARSKVGSQQGTYSFYVYDREIDSIYSIVTDSIPGIRDLPDYLGDYPQVLEARKKKNEARPVRFVGTSWSPMGSNVVLDIRSLDNKDRWLMGWDTASRQLKLVSRQRDEAWIGGPGMFGSQGWLDENRFWYQSEESGYSHIYIADLQKGESKALTQGNFEIQSAQLSLDKKNFYVRSNQIHPGEQHLHVVNIATGKMEKVTNMTGASQGVLSPDEKYFAFLYSSPTEPWELYWQENKPGAKSAKAAIRITNAAKSAEFQSYKWREPEIVTITARDGATIYARLYKPENPHPSKPAVFFTHGAGYLQNAHKWWSSYFREFMFNNMLADQGYYVLDIDYRGSAGYGRDWRTGIYRHMGGRDLSDHVDAAQWLVKNHGVNPANIGVYGGSYGGFITLMGLFTEPDVFKSGAALRPVTDWAQYNHGYTSNILNEPYTDSIAYRRSSPLYFAEGLKGHLLICHGMVDVNVHYQDAVKLAQRLIELGKDDWELASYPMEDHGFIEPSSWTDEYKRIFKLFERTLKASL